MQVLHITTKNKITFQDDFVSRERFQLVKFSKLCNMDILHITIKNEITFQDDFVSRERFLLVKFSKLCSMDICSVQMLLWKWKIHSSYFLQSTPLYTFMAYHWIFNKSNMMGVTKGAGISTKYTNRLQLVKDYVRDTAYLFEAFVIMTVLVRFVLQNMQFSVQCFVVQLYFAVSSLFGHCIVCYFIYGF